MRPFAPRALTGPQLAVAVVTCCLAAVSTVQAGQKAASKAGAKGEATKKYALVVGCTEYKNCPAIPALDGPANDIPFIAGVLLDLGFPKGNITHLVGWPTDPKARPTYANIVAGFEDLVKKADPNTQIYIHMAGHGIQAPIPEKRKLPVDPTNLKLDGMDRVFLPADVKEWREGNLDNALLDDQIGRYLDAMAARGAAVWIVLDCCHSGTMARAFDPTDVERSREVPPAALKIPDKAFEDAAARARKALEKIKIRPGGEKPRSVEDFLDAGMLRLSPRQSSKGSVVAFYACQPFERAPELPRPRGEPAVQKNYYGLLGYTIGSILRSHAKSRMTYRELAQLIAANYQAERGSRNPTPFAEGDLDREVLGMRTWPKHAHMILERVEGKLRVSGGGVLTLTRGSTLAVYPPKDDPRDPKTVLGYLKVVGLTPFYAEVEPCAHGKAPAAEADKLPARGPCTVVSQDIGEMRVRLAVGKRAGGAGKPSAEEAKRRQNLAKALTLLAEDTQKLLLLTEDQAKAEWVLWLQGDKVELRQGDGRSSIDPKEDVLLEKAAAAGKPVSRVLFGKYDADDPDAIRAGLERDLQKIFTWRNVWRVAGAMGAKGDAEAQDAVIEVVKLNAKTGAPEGKLEPGSPVRPGQRIELRVQNAGREDLWITILFLDANCGIKQFDARAVQAGEKLKPLRGKISPSSNGREGFVVLAVPVKAHRTAPDFTFLQQAPLDREEVRERSVRLRSAEKTAQTPFARLMTTAAFGGRTRDFEPDAPTTPAVLSWSWQTVAATPAAPAPKRP